MRTTESFPTMEFFKGLSGLIYQESQKKGKKNLNHISHVNNEI